MTYTSIEPLKRMRWSTTEPRRNSIQREWIGFAGDDFGHIVPVGIIHHRLRDRLPGRLSAFCPSSSASRSERATWSRCSWERCT